MSVLLKKRIRMIVVNGIVQTRFIFSLVRSVTKTCASSNYYIKTSFKHSAKDSNTLNASYAILSPLLLFGNGSSTSSSVSFPSLAAKISSTSHIEVDINQKITSAIFDAASASVPKFSSKKF
ncbi:hypothetical protein BpHYR1_016177 [Brachionus plicatilis]|uniref:Uncharacterized protein n=1 Tax=Brachionus plicatilis TaxID=10195 RepID=A0A3M7PH25_BRAPC|nr:hypothetical protein BpHYR1_016177 [Brachionus plicatilis]